MTLKSHDMQITAQTRHIQLLTSHTSRGGRQTVLSVSLGVPLGTSLRGIQHVRGFKSQPQKDSNLCLQPHSIHAHRSKGPPGVFPEYKFCHVIPGSQYPKSSGKYAKLGGFLWGRVSSRRWWCSARRAIEAKVFYNFVKQVMKSKLSALVYL